MEEKAFMIIPSLNLSFDMTFPLTLNGKCFTKYASTMKKNQHKVAGRNQQEKGDLQEKDLFLLILHDLLLSTFSTGGQCPWMR